ncbi:MAG: DUF262 domain-containing protein [Elusimicrobiota bacterium]|jgi:hypothetical protein|nr:DUF262 domain-containing protein [Elusimicrobiota bacterium]
MSKELLSNWFEKNRYKIVMPNIQRDFVWKEKQIENLFDSIYKGYFIGMFWIWEPKNQKELKKLGYWSLPSEFRTKEFDKNTEEKGDDVIGIIDGQQRLSALSIGLHGSYDEKELYLNVKEAKFRFLRKKFIDSIKDKDQDNWIKVRDILESKHKNAKEFKKAFKESLLIKQTEHGTIEQITEIFRRINKGGTPLSNNQELLSQLTNNWSGGRRELEKTRKKINKGNGIAIDYDFIIKCCLFLLEEPLNIKQALIGDTLSKIKDKWEKISEAIKRVAEKLKELGFSSSKNITSDNALIPIAYMYYKNKKADDDIIKKYLFSAFLKRVYGGSSDTILMRVRKYMEKEDISELLDKPEFQFNDSDISRIVSRKQSKYTYLALMILYDDYDNDKKTFEQDHMHPKSFFSTQDKLKEAIKDEMPENDDWDKHIDELSKQNFSEWREKCDCLPNLRLESRSRNRKKNDSHLAKWWTKGREKGIQKAKHYLKEDTRLELYYFKDFYKTREQKIKEKLKKYFGIEGNEK